MKKKLADDVVLVLSATGAGHIAKMLSRSKERRQLFTRILNMADIHVLDPSTGTALYRWKYLYWRKRPTAEVAELLELIGNLEDNEFLFARLGVALDDIELMGGYTRNPFRVSIAREITMTI